eukprot:3301063-Amphidinium_carterae.1
MAVALTPVSFMTYDAFFAVVAAVGIGHLKPVGRVQGGCVAAKCRWHMHLTAPVAPTGQLAIVKVSAVAKQMDDTEANAATMSTMSHQWKAWSTLRRAIECTLPLFKVLTTLTSRSGAHICHRMCTR